MPNIKDSVYFVEVMLLFQRGVVDWDEGMGELYYTNDGCLFSVPDAGLCGRKSTGFVGEWVVCLHVYTPRKIVSFSTPRQTGLIFPLRSCIDLRNLIQSRLACSGADVLCV